MVGVSLVEASEYSEERSACVSTLSAIIASAPVFTILSVVLSVGFSRPSVEARPLAAKARPLHLLEDEWLELLFGIAWL